MRTLLRNLWRWFIGRPIYKPWRWTETGPSGIRVLCTRRGGQQIDWRAP